MNATILPINATNLNFDWSVINGTGSATIDESGLLSPTSIGDVTVKAVAQDGSNVSGEKVITITEPVGITNHASNIWSIYPNPSQKLVHIKGNGVKEIEVFSLDGKQIYKLEYQNKIDISELESGVYLLKLVSFENTEIHRLLKE